MGWYRLRTQFNRRRGPKRPVGQIVAINDRKHGIIDLGSAISRDVRRLIDENILTRGEPFKSGGALGTACLPILGAGSAAASSLFAGNVFLATANPATLMQIGAGVGSAVMSGGKVVAQAPFIAAGTAIIPVVLPVMFFMTVAAMMVSVRFGRLEHSLKALHQAVREVLRRDVLEDYGEVLSAIKRLEDISSEFKESKRFTDEMKIRLALVERDLSAVHHQYGLISESVATETGAQLAPTDQHIFALSGIASICVDSQRLRLALQDNPDDAKRSAKVLNEKIQKTRSEFAKLLDLEDNPIASYQKELKRSLEDMNWWDKHVVERRERREKEVELKHVSRIREDDLRPMLKSMKSWSDSPDKSDDPGLAQSVVYYREDDGEGELKAYYTDDLTIG